MQGVKIVKQGLNKWDGFKKEADALEVEINTEIQKLTSEGKKILNVSISHEKKHNKTFTYLASILWEN